MGGDVMNACMSVEKRNTPIVAPIFTKGVACAVLYMHLWVLRKRTPLAAPVDLYTGCCIYTITKCYECTYGC